MSALVFPPNPSVGQPYSQNGKSWTWNGVAWMSTNPPAFRTIIPIQGQHVVGFRETNAAYIVGDLWSELIINDTDSEAIETGVELKIFRINGEVVITPVGQVTLYRPTVDPLGTPRSHASLIKIANLTWILSGGGDGSGPFTDDPICVDP